MSSTAMSTAIGGERFEGAFDARHDRRHRPVVAVDQIAQRVGDDVVVLDDQDARALERQRRSWRSPAARESRSRSAVPRRETAAARGRRPRRPAPPRSAARRSRAAPGSATGGPPPRFHQMCRRGAAVRFDARPDRPSDLRRSTGRRTWPRWWPARAAPCPTRAPARTRGRCRPNRSRRCRCGDGRDRRRARSARSSVSPSQRRPASAVWMRAIAWMRPEKAALNSSSTCDERSVWSATDCTVGERVLDPVVELAHGEAQRILGAAMLAGSRARDARFASRRCLFAAPPFALRACRARARCRRSTWVMTTVEASVGAIVPTFCSQKSRGACTTVATVQIAVAAMRMTLQQLPPRTPGNERGGTTDRPRQRTTGVVASPARMPAAPARDDGDDVGAETDREVEASGATGRRAAQRHRDDDEVGCLDEVDRARDAAGR